MGLIVETHNLLLRLNNLKMLKEDMKRKRLEQEFIPEKYMAAGSSWKRRFAYYKIRLLCYERKIRRS